MRILRLSFAKSFWLSSGFAVLAVCQAAAQSPEALGQFFEGKQVKVKLDMPASQKGIEIFPNRPQPLDTKSYASRLKQFGVSLRSGDTVVVTKVKVKDDNLEFQLGGGGYGTALDPSDTSVHFTPADKSSHEKELEDQLKTETDEDRRRSLSRELDDLRRERERRDRRDRMSAEEDADMRKQSIAANRLQGGSRFNIHFDKRKTGEAVTPQAVMQALAQYVSFSPEVAGAEMKTEAAASPQASSAPSSKDLRKGLTRAEVEQLFGPATETHTRTQDALTITTCTYNNATETVQADFVNGVLVQYTVSSR